MKSRQAPPLPRAAVGYVRVSTTRQAEEGLSLAAQRDRIAHTAAAHGLALQRPSFADEGISGRRVVNRPGLAAAVAAAKAVKGVLIVYSLSRFARSTRDCLALLAELEAGGVDLVSITDAIDTTSAHGRFYTTLLAALAQLESDVTSERVRAIVAHMRSRGEAFGKLPFGTRLAKDGRHVEADPRERAIIARVVTLRAKGKTWRAIAEALAAGGMRTRTGGAFFIEGACRIFRNHATPAQMKAAAAHVAARPRPTPPRPAKASHAGRRAAASRTVARAKPTGRGT